MSERGPAKTKNWPLTVAMEVLYTRALLRAALQWDWSLSFCGDGHLTLYTCSAPNKAVRSSRGGELLFYGLSIPRAESLLYFFRSETFSLSGICRGKEWKLLVFSALPSWLGTSILRPSIFLVSHTWSRASTNSGDWLRGGRPVSRPCLPRIELLSRDKKH